MKFRPCIDLHQGKVKQIIGSSLVEGAEDKLITNFTSQQTAAWFAIKYRADQLKGGHIIQLGEGCSEAAREALQAWPGGLQIGGGINEENAISWLEAGASALIVTSYVFRQGEIDWERLQKLSTKIGSDKLVLDLSCRKLDNLYWIVTDRWQKFTKVTINKQTLNRLSRYCSEFLVHAVDVEGKANGIEKELVAILGGWNQIPITYAGGIHNWQDIKLIASLGRLQVDFTVGSALDMFGGKQLKYTDLVSHNRSGYNNTNTPVE